MAKTAVEAFGEALEAGVDSDEGFLRAATSVGLIAEPGLDVEATVARFESLAAEVAAELRPLANLHERVVALNAALFQRRGFHGNHDEYNDPRNCLVHELLDRRTGIPITLSLLYVLVGRRAGMPLVGVGFPAHFIARVGEDPADCIYVDAFNEGRELSREELAQLLRHQGGNPDRQLDGFLAAVTPRQILSRILNNVEGMYHRQRKYVETREAIELHLVLTPWAFDKIRDRGLVSAQLGDLKEAAEDLATYLTNEPYASDYMRVDAVLAAIRRRLYP